MVELYAFLKKSLPQIEAERKVNRIVMYDRYSKYVTYSEVLRGD